MNKYGINTNSKLWKLMIKDEVDGSDVIKLLDSEFFPNLDSAVRNYFRKLRGVVVETYAESGWRILYELSSEDRQVEWFSIHVQLKFPSANFRASPMLQITGPDKGNIRNQAWVSEVEKHIDAVLTVARGRRRYMPIKGASFVDEPYIEGAHAEYR